MHHPDLVGLSRRVYQTKAEIIDNGWYIKTRGVHNVVVRGPPGSHVHPPPPPRAEPKWYQNDRMNLLFQNRDVPIKTTLTENT